MEWAVSVLAVARNAVPKSMLPMSSTIFWHGLIDAIKAAGECESRPGRRQARGKPLEIPIVGSRSEFSASSMLK